MMLMRHQVFQTTSVVFTE